MSKVVVGSSLASLVCVLELAKKYEVTWIQTSKNIGGHFAGKVVNALQVDLGMVALEPYQLTEAHPRRNDFPPLRQNGLGSVGVAFDWLRDMGENFSPIKVKSLFRGKLIDDFMIADSLEVLLELTHEEKCEVKNQLTKTIQKLKVNPTLHPKQKNTSQAFLETNLHEMMVSSIGSTLPTIIYEPWINRFNNKVWSLIPSRDHRTIWLPLYYPETLLEYLETGKNTGEFSSRPFVVPHQSTVANLIARLYKIAIHSNVRILNYDRKALDLSSQYYMLASTMEIANILNFNLNSNLVDYVECPIEIVTLVFSGSLTTDQICNLVENGTGPYRVTFRNVTNSSAQMKSLVSVEFGEEFSSLTDARLISLAQNTIQEMGYSEMHEDSAVSRANLKIPVRGSRSMLEHNRDIVYQALRERRLSGFPIDFGSSAFNDQVMLGLWVAREGELV